MLDCVMAQGDERSRVREAAKRTLVGGQLLLWAGELAPGRVVTVAQVEGARARRALGWPELLADWSEIHETRPYPGEATPALAQQLSALGVPAFAVAFDGARAAAAVAWFEGGALISLEHVGEATVAWTPEEGLGRPRMAGVRGGLMAAARSLGGEETILDRIEAQHAAGSRAIVERALVRLCDRPPAIDEFAGWLALQVPERLYL
ncbi:MAG TPA: hypothetical protein VH877_30710 [Polyangia bacterium]|jgi:hypothetical protein|nr:hypothetical protein [Polyangia bacterium]